MKTLLIVSHPEINDSSTQHFLKKSVQLPEVTWHHLDGLYRDQKVDVVKERALLQAHDRILFQFPLYWYSAPSLLKQWQDAVLDENLSLAKKEFGIVTTVGVKLSEYQAGGKEKFTFSELLKPFEAMANKFEMTYLPPFLISQFAYLTEGKRKELLVKYQQYVTMTQPATFAEKENWFLQQMSGEVSLNLKVADQQLFEAVRQKSQENQERLQELTWTLAEIKNG